MDNYNKEKTAVDQVIKAYSDGIFLGDVALLRRAFAPTAILYGDLPGTTYEKPLEEYLNIVAERKSPKELGETFDPQVLSVEIWGNVGYVKAHVPMLGYNYYDFLSLFKTKDGWKIVNKMFIHVD